MDAPIVQAISDHIVLICFIVIAAVGITNL